MSVHLQIRDLPDELHQTLRERAQVRGVSLRQYALDILREHCRQPTLDEWLVGLGRLMPAEGSIDSAAAVRAARDEDDAERVDVLKRP
jgi:antitoxin FitA